MAGDKKTILDIVKAVDEKEFFKKEREFYDKVEDSIRPSDMTMEVAKNMKRMFTGDLRIPRVYKEDMWFKEKNKEHIEIPRLVKKALSEENPTAGGTYKGSIYYSNILPQGSPMPKWTEKRQNIIDNAFSPKAKEEDVIKAQNLFVEIGYMDKSEVDGRIGPQLVGIRRRWNQGPGVSNSMFDKLKDINIFGD